MIETKKEITYNKILSILLRSDYVTVSFIASNLSLSAKTIRNRIDEIKITYDFCGGNILIEFNRSDKRQPIGQRFGKP